MATASTVVEFEARPYEITVEAVSDTPSFGNYPGSDGMVHYEPNWTSELPEK